MKFKLLLKLWSVSFLIFLYLAVTHDFNCDDTLGGLPVKSGSTSLLCMQHLAMLRV